MISILEELITGISNATELPVYSEMPDGGFALPMIVISEINYQLSTLAFSNHVEVAKVTYQISIYSDNVDDIFTYQELIENYFKTNIQRFKGTASAVQQRYPIYYRTLTYDGKIKKQNDDYYIL